MKATKSCGIIVFRKTNSGRSYLIIHDGRNNKWGFPKGHKILLETDLQTARREVYEEVGLKPHLVSDHTITVEFINKRGIHRTVTYFIGEISDETVKLQPEEISEFRWLKYDDALTLINFEQYRDALIQAEQYLNENKK